MNAKEKILKAGDNGRFFSCCFEKKDGSVREMNCRLGVRKFVTGKGMSYDPEERGLMTVWDAQVKEYRMINLKKVISVNGEKIDE